MVRRLPHDHEHRARGLEFMPTAAPPLEVLLLDGSSSFRGRRGGRLLAPKGDDNEGSDASCQTGWPSGCS